jgi:tRNA-uridine 2-sulfurtransferase
MSKVIIGLSGGVDSAVAAYLLKNQGHKVEAVYLECWSEPGCRADQDRQDAMKIALCLNIPFKILDFKKEYKSRVMDYFFDEYKKGRTPNPDILCNSVIKFGLFYNWIMKNGYDFVATGHYARIRNYESGIVNHGKTGTKNSKTNKLFTPKDLKKDQTYFLYKIKKDQLAHLLFPLADLTKSEVRHIARENKLAVADKKDSMGICFVGDINVSKLLKQKFGVKKGKVVLKDGTIIGQHDGHWLFTVGKRGEWQRIKKIYHPDLSSNKLPKLYVADIKPKDNIIIVGERDNCFNKEFFIKNIDWIDSSQDIQVIKNLNIKIRNTGAFLPARIIKASKKYLIKLKKAEFGVSSGQSCVFYQKTKKGYLVLGGGVIEKNY